MACGCIPIVPVLGGTGEYAVHGRNAFVVDTRSDREVLSAVDAFITMTPGAVRKCGKPPRDERRVHGDQSGIVGVADIPAIRRQGLGQPGGKCTMP